MWRQMINDNRVVLIRDLYFRDIRDHLMQDKVLIDNEIEDIDAEKTRYAQVSRMLDILRRKPEAILQKYWRCLETVNSDLYQSLQLSAVVTSGREDSVDASPRSGEDTVDCDDPRPHKPERKKGTLGLMQSELEDWYINTLSRLHPVPWCEWLELDLDHVFTNLEVVPALKHKFDLGMGLRIPAEEGDQSPEAVLGLIFPTEGSTTRRCISLVEGPAGIGKSTLCRRLVYSWAKNDHWIHSHQFDLALVLEGKTLTDNLKECIAQQLFPEDFKLNEDELFKCVKKCEGKCVLIIDGIDELTSEGNKLVVKILSGGLLRHAHVLITGRPEAARGFVKYVNMHLVVKGFTFDNVESYVCKYFGSDEERFRNILMDKLRNDFRLQQLATNPFTTLLLCLLVQDYNGDIPSNEIDIYHQVLLAICNNYISKFDTDAHQERLGISSDSLLYAAGKAAYEGVKTLTVVFAETDISNICPIGLGQHLLKSGLMNRDFTMSRLHSKGYCYFPHKTLQDYLCAHYLASLEETQLSAILRPLSFDYRYNINMLRFLFKMLSAKDAQYKAVLRYLCWKIDQGENLLTVVEKLRWALLLCLDSGATVSQLQCVADGICANDRLSRAFCYGSFYNYWAGKIVQCWPLILNKMTLKPVVVLHDQRLKLRMGGRCERDICHFFRKDKHLNVTTALQFAYCRQLLIRDVSLNVWSEVFTDNPVWPCIHCKSVEAALAILKCNIVVELLAVTLMPGMFTTNELATFAETLALISRPMSVLFVIPENPHTDHLSMEVVKMANQLSLTSTRIRVRSSLLKPYSSKVHDSESVSNDIQSHKQLELETIYVLRDSVQQIYYNSLCPY